MWRSIIVTLALVCLGLLGYYAVTRHPGKVELALEAAAKQAIEPRFAGVTVEASQRDLILFGNVATEDQRAEAEKVAAQVSGVASVKNMIVVPAAVPAPAPAPAKAELALELSWTGTELTLSGALPSALQGDLDQRLMSTFDTETVAVVRKLELKEGELPDGAKDRLLAAIDGLGKMVDGKARVDAGLSLTGNVATAELEAQVKALIEKAGGSATLTVKPPAVAEPVAEGADATGEVSDATAEVADAPTDEVQADAGPAEVAEAQPDAAAAEVAAPVPPTGPLTAAQCKAEIAALIEGDKRITFKPNTGRLTPEGEAKLAEVWAVLQRCPDAKGIIEGYHDDYGDPDKLKELTQIRAYNTHKRLMDMGMPKERFRYIGLGYRNMRYGGKPEMRVLNQRIEFNITVE